ncbi:MAG TPA: 30S ribosomal protein S3 [Rectinema sp.]|nr:30S ribosomal protein S3 [Spirochaetaceae bacterium]HNV19092.1 30S ribosomal protein S3 [Rectinema sp.]HNY99278.1 30S ribosomal protein S3 [Rectinema sp.]HOE76275.1 30S ribosomal protein S3 [Rectinema sp.]HOH05472.1 30S ribosomal protein S3 [Rectinema sp.]
MGQKVNPIGLRIGINKEWSSHWYVEPREYAKTLHEDLAIRRRLLELEETKGADISEIEIIRHPQRITLVIHSARPGVLIGTKGANIDKIGAQIQKVTQKKLQIKIKEIKKVDTNAQLVAQNIARQLENRQSFRRAMKSAIQNALKGGAQGCKVRLSGRLGGSDMSRTEELKDGRIPLHTLRADIDYGFAEANTTFGKIGVKVWIYQGMVYSQDKNEDAGQLARKARRESLGEPRGERRESGQDRQGRRERVERAELGEQSDRNERRTAPRPEASRAEGEARS